MQNADTKQACEGGGSLAVKAATDETGQTNSHTGISSCRRVHRLQAALVRSMHGCRIMEHRVLQHLLGAE